ncbi:HTH-type transcriptional regulator CysB [Usitatibacter palustris]|uniref:HTH-type transcriptional regulator CysB n=1 Tax=Usitatibacter palustris TaxID=2732487 RepID=A0A6M4HA61_9PROT|nr:CysB family HTH-type transcriptional regulator [Usitatibacter palustris]QJR15593.1 HTH-type transcriptional regulator CysB [Usitatibacter palustris]
MNLQQLKYAQEVAKRDLNVSAAAAALHTSQPGVSRQLRELEKELGAAIFVRQGKRLTSITDAGREILERIDRILSEVGNLRGVGEEFGAGARGQLSVAITHTQARYALPPVITEFKKRFPQVKLKLLQGNPNQLAKHVLAGEADLAIATEALTDYPELVTLPCYQWHHCVVVPEGHPLAGLKRLTLEAIAEHPIVTYDPMFAGRTSVDRSFAARGLSPEIVLTALDSDVIKSYVSLGLGVGIISSRAFREGKDEGLVALDCGHLFAAQTTRLAYKRGAYLRSFTVEFIRMFVPRLRREDLEGLENRGADPFEGL